MHPFKPCLNHASSSYTALEPESDLPARSPSPRLLQPQVRELAQTGKREELGAVDPVPPIGHTDELREGRTGT